jgi:hypothetical protein
MSAISVTPASVLKGSGATVVNGLAGATITAGQSVYFDSATAKYKLAQDDGTAEEAGASGVGIALNGASDGQPLSVQTQGPITIGGTVAVGESYYLGDAAGAVVPYGDLGSTDKITYLGVGTSATVIALQPHVTGAAKA